MNLLTEPRHRKFAIAILSVLVLAGVGIVAADQVILRDPHILPNVQVAYIPVGGLTTEEAEKKLLTAYSTSQLPPIVLTDKTEVWLINSQEIDLSVDIPHSISQAFSLGRSSSFFERWRERLDLQGQIRNLPIQVLVNRSKLEKQISLLTVPTERQARDAVLVPLLQSKDVALIPSAEGRNLDVARTVAEAFATPQHHLAFVIELKFNKQSPKVADTHFDGLNTMLASFSSYFKSWDYDRNENLRLAASRIHGKILKPGDVFSYNQIVGNRTFQQGFRMAPVILDGKLVPDWGGGVCQVSSTLYNAALLADLDIVDRSNHGRAIGYVPLGFDATVVDGQIDFKFKNSLKHPVMLYSIITDNQLYFFVIGNAKDAPPPIELDYVVLKVYEPVEIKQPDPTLEVGSEVVDESPQRGFRVSTYRIRKIDGKEVRQLLATDDYDPVNRIVKIGTKNKTGSSEAVTVKQPDKLPGQPSAPGVSGTITLQKPAQTPRPSPATPTKR